MAHRIAMSAGASINPPVNVLYLAFLTKSGEVWTYVQSANGVWKNAGPIQEPPGGAAFSSVLGLENILLALGNGQLYYSFFYGGHWSQFAPLPVLQGVSFTDFGAAGIERVGLLVVGQATDGNFYAQYGSPDGGSLDNATQPALIPGFAPGVSSPSVAGIPSDQSYGIAVVMGVGAAGSANPLQCVSGVYNGNNFNWEPANVPQQLVVPPFTAPPSSVLVTPGNPYVTLQAILLSGLLPNLVWDSSGEGSTWVNYGLLPSLTALLFPLSFATIAAGLNNGGILQVVGIGAFDNLPCLIWQDTEGNWWPYINVRLPNPSAIQVVDLAIGQGGQPNLQVGYLGQDGNIYVNFQDAQGNWGWYGPLP